MAMFEGDNPLELLKSVIEINSDPDQLQQTFQFPSGRKLIYNVLAPKDKWVMISDNEIILDRNFDTWPLIEGDLKGN